MWHGENSKIPISRTIGYCYAGCSKRPFSKAAASEEARRTLRYVEPLSDARTPLADFFNILLALCNLVQDGFHLLFGQPLQHRLGFLQIRRDTEAFAIDACQRSL